ncbi:MAG: membrane integrity-associated transporter subunit PqiC [Tropicimonas sp.]|uniref:PqiC family protein n=1 Tax=Tropicimonas sp. TaxID=2067044 RepID=UPI003A836613
MRSLILLVPLLTALAACGQSPSRYASPPVASGERISIGLSQLEIREVTLPAYAQSEEIWHETEEGGLESNTDVLWADTPARGVTMELTQHLAALSSARVAAEPWPFEELPQARLVVRLQDMVARKDGRFHLAGQYYVVRLSAGSDRSGTFDISAPIAPEGGAAAVAAARAAAVRDLARLIADRGF